MSAHSGRAGPVAAPAKDLPPVTAELEQDGSLLVLTLQRPRANILDTAMIAALRREVQAANDLPALRTILLTGAGSHFSFGASVVEHQPEQVGDMLEAFHGLLRDLLDCGRVLLAAVRGQCLGGGLEVVSLCQRVFAAPDARLGQPEIKLGVLAPAASVVLPLRLGQARAEDLLLTGRTVVVEEALTLGLVDDLAADPLEAAREWHRAHLAPHSAAALRFAAQAARGRLARALHEELPVVERLYLTELMATHDAREGIAAFLEKREATWKHA